MACEFCKETRMVSSVKLDIEGKEVIGRLRLDLDHNDIDMQMVHYRYKETNGEKPDLSEWSDSQPINVCPVCGGILIDPDYAPQYTPKFIISHTTLYDEADLNPVYKFYTVAEAADFFVKEYDNSEKTMSEIYADYNVVGSLDDIILLNCAIMYLSQVADINAGY